jgi:hypothetical protein
MTIRDLMDALPREIVDDEVEIVIDGQRERVTHVECSEGTARLSNWERERKHRAETSVRPETEKPEGTK